MAICVPSIRQQQRGCNAHIVRLAEYQAVKKIDPQGVEIRKLLILRQTNNVCVAPPAPLRLLPSAKSSKKLKFYRNQSQTHRNPDKIDHL